MRSNNVLLSSDSPRRWSLPVITSRFTVAEHVSAHHTHAPALLYQLTSTQAGGSTPGVPPTAGSVCIVPVKLRLIVVWKVRRTNLRNRQKRRHPPLPSKHESNTSLKQEPTTKEQGEEHQQKRDRKEEHIPHATHNETDTSNPSWPVELWDVCQVVR